MKDDDIYRVAIIYPYAAHYRYPVFRELVLMTDIEFTLISDIKSPNDIKLIDEQLADEPIEKCGLRWRFVKNVWITKDKLLWQVGLVRECFFKNYYRAIIFLGNPYYLSTWVCAVIGRCTGKSVFFWTHGIIKNCINAKNCIRMTFYRIGNGLLLYGNRAKKILSEMGIPESKMHVIYNSLDYRRSKILRNSFSEEELLNFREQLFGKRDCFQILFIGRLTKRKKIDQLLRAAAILLEKGRRISILIVGAGEQYNELKMLANDLEIDNNLVFYGESYNEDENSRLISSSDLCVSPGEVGLTAIQALSYGTPVMTHNDFDNQMPEVEAIVEGYSGAFFDRDNIEDMAIRIEEWIQNNRDRNIVRKNCFKVIDELYNPIEQARLISKAVVGDWPV